MRFCFIIEERYRNKPITQEIGHVFHLHLYGVDLLMTERGQMVVDINSIFITNTRN